MSGVNVVNYPPNGWNRAIRQVGFNVGERITVLLEVSPDGDDDYDITVTVGGAAENEDIPEFLSGVGDTFTQMFGTPEFSEEWAENLRQQSSESEGEE